MCLVCSKRRKLVCEQTPAASAQPPGCSAHVRTCLAVRLPMHMMMMGDVCLHLCQLADFCLCFSSFLPAAAAGGEPGAAAHAGAAGGAAGRGGARAAGRAGAAQQEGHVWRLPGPPRPVAAAAVAGRHCLLQLSSRCSCCRRLDFLKRAQLLVGACAAGGRAAVDLSLSQKCACLSLWATASQYSGVPGSASVYVGLISSDKFGRCQNGGTGLSKVGYSCTGAAEAFGWLQKYA